MIQTDWWKSAVVYQIYPKSFQDTNDDGIGDLRGIIQHLDYIKELGATVIWLNPIYPSPQVDNGYDIADYQNVHSTFGTLEDFKELLEKAHSLGIKVILDMVLNHTSDQHPWFLKSKPTKDNNPYRDYYFWRPANTHKDGIWKGDEPNNWGNYFYEGEGSAWEWDSVTKEYYLHNYSKHMPDLNWDCEALRKEIYDMLNWWCDMGVDGFRLDAVNRLQKPAGLPNSLRPCAPPVNPNVYIVDREMCANQPGITKLLQELKENVFIHHDIMTVGEMGNTDSEQAKAYIDQKTGAINMIFHFEIAKNPKLVSVPEYKEIQKRWAKVIENGGWGSQYLTNHDSPRQVSRFGNDTEFRVESAKMLAMLTHTQPGTVYVYQGEEIGMTNVYFPTIQDYDERYTVGKYTSMVQQGVASEEALDKLRMMSRDNVRTPMQWNSSPNGGFTPGKPWIRSNPNYSYINVEKALEDTHSVFYTYKNLIALRKKHPVMVFGNYVPVMEDYQNVVAYTREYADEKWLMLFNFQPFNQSIAIPEELLSQDPKLLMCNYSDTDCITKLRPYEGRIYQLCNPASRRAAYVCAICGYTVECNADENLPDDFICPICNHGASDFYLKK